MKSLNQFKKELGVEHLSFMKSKKTGRMFTTIGAVAIIVSQNFKPSEAAFVIHNEEKGFHVICNAGGVEAGIEL